MRTAFLSYSHKDSTSVAELKKHLKPLIRANIINLWSDVQILAGQDIDSEVMSSLSKADIILLLASPDFLASDYCFGIEMAEALERHKNDQAIIIPIILRRCQWKASPFGGLKATPTDGEAILSTFWLDKDEAWDVVATDIRIAAEGLSNKLLADINDYFPEEKPHSPSDELGILDYQIRFEENIEISTQIIGEISSEISSLGGRTSTISQKMQQVNQLGNPREKRLIVNEAAIIFEEYANSIQSKTSILREKTLSAISDAKSMLSLLSEYDASAEDIKAKDGFQISIHSLADSADESKASVLELRDTIQKLPRMTKEMNVSKRLLFSSINDFTKFIEEMSFAARGI